MTPQSTPDLMEPVVGLRAWHIKPTPAGPRLFGAGFGRTTRWTPYEPIEAKHFTYPYFLPSDVCQGSPCDGTPDPHSAAIAAVVGSEPQMTYCGIHAYRLGEEARAAKDFRAHFAADVEWSLGSQPVWVVGTVSLWGKIAEHAHGYRAQFAYPRELIMASSGVDLAALAAAYGITYTQEQSVWKSVFQFVESSQSHWHSLSPLGPMYVLPSSAKFQPFVNSLPSSRSSFQPSYISAPWVGLSPAEMAQLVEEEEAAMMLTALDPRVQNTKAVKEGE